MGTHLTDKLPLLSSSLLRSTDQKTELRRRLDFWLELRLRPPVKLTPLPPERHLAPLVSTEPPPPSRRRRPLSLSSPMTLTLSRSSSSFPLSADEWASHTASSRENLDSADSSV